MTGAPSAKVVPFAGGQVQLRAMQCDDQRLSLAFRALLAAVLLAVTLSLLIPTSESSSGVAQVGADGSVLLAFPAGVQPYLAAGLPVEVSLVQGDERWMASITITEVAGPRSSEQLRSQGFDSAGLGPVVVVAHAELPASAAPGGTRRGSARVLLRRGRIADLVIPDLQSGGS